MNNIYNELFDLDVAISRFDGTRALVGLLRDQFYCDMKPDQSKLKQGFFVTEQVLCAVEDLLLEQQKIFSAVSENLHEIYFANRTVLNADGVLA